jgi:hypothetical protein
MRNLVMFLAAAVLISMTSIPAFGFEMLWSQMLGTYKPQPTVDPDWDMTGDDMPEVVCQFVLCSEENPLRVFAHDGTPLWTYCPTADDVSPGTPPTEHVSFVSYGFADVDPHPGKEAVIGWELTNSIRGFAIVSPADNLVLASVPLDVGTASDAVLAVADFGGDIYDEVLITFRVVGLWQLQLWGHATPNDVEDQAPITHGTLVATPGLGGAQTLRFSLGGAGHVSCRVFAADGRSVRGLVVGDMPAGEHTIRWDGLDDAGQAAPAGVYFVRVETTDGVQSAKVVLAR